MVDITQLESAIWSIADGQAHRRRSCACSAQTRHASLTVLDRADPGGRRRTGFGSQPVWGRTRPSRRRLRRHDQGSPSDRLRAPRRRRRSVCAIARGPNCRRPAPAGPRDPAGVVGRRPDRRVGRRDVGRLPSRTTSWQPAWNCAADPRTAGPSTPASRWGVTSPPTPCRSRFRTRLGWLVAVNGARDTDGLGASAAVAQPGRPRGCSPRGAWLDRSAARGIDREQMADRSTDVFGGSAAATESATDRRSGTGHAAQRSRYSPITAVGRRCTRSSMRSSKRSCARAWTGSTCRHNRRRRRRPSTSPTRSLRGWTDRPFVPTAT